MEDILYSAVIYYENNLAHKKFQIKIAKKGEIKELTIIFTNDNFHHLAGLHKLTDLVISKKPPRNVYQEILDGKLTQKDIEKSSLFQEAEQRLVNLKKIQLLFKSDSLIVKSLKGNFIGITANYLLYKKDCEYKYIHLFLQEQNGKYVPVSFFPRNDENYIFKGSRWTILSIQEIDR